MGATSVGSADSYAEARRLAAEGPARRITHTVAGLSAGAVYDVEILDCEHGNVAEAWHQRGEPLNLSRQDVAELRQVADDLDRRTLTVDDDGVLAIDLELPAWAVASIAPTTTH
jgi:xylan 1,4-beta-xylosidase